LRISSAAAPAPNSSTIGGAGTSVGGGGAGGGGVPEEVPDDVEVDDELLARSIADGGLDDLAAFAARIAALAS